MHWIFRIFAVVKALKPMDWVFISAQIGAFATYFHNRNSSLKSDAIKAQGEQISQYQSGGDSFGEVVIVPINDQVADLYFHNHGNLPMYDVSIRVVNPFDNPKAVVTEEDAKMAAEMFKLIDIGTMAPNFKKPIGQIKRNLSGRKLFFFVDINARNGGLHQETVFRREMRFTDKGERIYPDSWYYQTRISRDGTNIFFGSNAPEGYTPSE